MPNDLEDIAWAFQKSNQNESHPESGQVSAMHLKCMFYEGLGHDLHLHLGQKSYKYERQFSQVNIL